MRRGSTGQAQGATAEEHGAGEICDVGRSFLPTRHRSSEKRTPVLADLRYPRAGVIVGTCSRGTTHVWQAIAKKGPG